MLEALLVVVIVLLIAVAALQAAQLTRKVQVDLSAIEGAFGNVEKSNERTERAVREEVAKNRQELSQSARDSRAEMNTTLKSMGDSLDQRLLAVTKTNDEKLGAMRETIDQRLTLLQEDNAGKLDKIRQESTQSGDKTRNEVSKSVNDFMSWQRVQFGTINEQVKALTESNDKRLGELRKTLEDRIKSLQEDNEKKLEQMRQTVDEKLESTLTTRLGESFKLVSERLEQVHNGLGEMQALATGVGDLKRVLTNVKARGEWGEVQLERLLEEGLAPGQYEKNVPTGDGRECVEFAVKLPGRGEHADEILYLPIDAKFPLEDYQRLVEAQDQCDSDAIAELSKQLEARIKGCAEDICRKYLNPPQTTDFGIMFLPTEGLFAEVIRRPGLVEHIRQKWRVTITGPTTLWAYLMALQLGFRTLAIEKKTSEVWSLLGAVKTEFGKYGEVMDKVQKKLQSASNEVEEVAKRSRAIERKLRTVEELPMVDAQNVLMLDTVDVDPDGNGAVE